MLSLADTVVWYKGKFQLMNLTQNVDHARHTSFEN